MLSIERAGDRYEIGSDGAVSGVLFFRTFSSCFGAEVAPGILEIACKMLERTLGMLCECESLEQIP